ncbi:hypothetical protein ACYSNM_00200 [Myroides sp. LJL116]
MNEEQVQRQIMAIMAQIAKGESQQALVKIETLKEIIYQVLDTTTQDKELAVYGKYLKIVEELQRKLD